MLNWATGSALLEAGAASPSRNAAATHGHTPAGVINLTLRFVIAIVALLLSYRPPSRRTSQAPSSRDRGAGSIPYRPAVSQRRGLPTKIVSTCSSDSAPSFRNAG